VVFDVLEAILQTPDPERGVRMQEAANERLAVRVENLLELEMLLRVDNLLEGALLVSSREGSGSAHQLIEDHSIGPEISSAIVTLSEHDLRR
jgi:hypothetical protein